MHLLFSIVQVSLAVRGGYVPEKFGILEYQNRLFRPNLGLVIIIFPYFLVRE